MIGSHSSITQSTRNRHTKKTIQRTGKKVLWVDIVESFFYRICIYIAFLINSPSLNRACFLFLFSVL